MNSAHTYILAVVIILVILIITYIAYGRRSTEKKTRDRFMPGDAATPKIRSAVGSLGKDLACVSAHAGQVKMIGDRVERTYGSVHLGAALDTARTKLVSGCQGMCGITQSIGRLGKTLEIMTPTYQNALGLYKGLRNSDTTLREVAETLGTAGEQMQELVASTDDHDHTAQAHTAAAKNEIAMAAVQLRQVSCCLYSLVRSVSLLGNALQLE